MNKIFRNQAGFGTKGIIITTVIVVAVLAGLFMFKAKKEKTLNIQ